MLPPARVQSAACVVAAVFQKSIAAPRPVTIDRVFILIVISSSFSVPVAEYPNIPQQLPTHADIETYIH
jgi:uncharacterized membrane protein